MGLGQQGLTSEVFEHLGIGYDEQTKDPKERSSTASHPAPNSKYNTLKGIYPQRQAQGTVEVFLQSLG